MSEIRNIHKPPMRVHHTNLRRWDDESPYKSTCPACNVGPLLVCRDHRSFRLISLDRCLSCGQAVIYDDATINGEPVIALDPPPN